MFYTTTADISAETLNPTTFKPVRRSVWQGTCHYVFIPGKCYVVMIETGPCKVNLNYYIKLLDCKITIHLTICMPGFYLLVGSFYSIQTKCKFNSCGCFSDSAYNIMIPKCCIQRRSQAMANCKCKTVLAARFLHIVNFYKRCLWNTMPYTCNEKLDCSEVRMPSSAFGKISFSHFDPASPPRGMGCQWSVSNPNRWTYNPSLVTVWLPKL